MWYFMKDKTEPLLESDSMRDAAESAGKEPLLESAAEQLTELAHGTTAIMYRIVLHPVWDSMVRILAVIKITLLSF